jgi:hypothetical protein
MPLTVHAFITVITIDMPYVIDVDIVTLPTCHMADMPHANLVTLLMPL